MALLLARHGIRGFTRDRQACRIVPGRKWEFDFVQRELMIGLEVDGGAFRGRHAGGKYLRASHERQNAAQLAGWMVLRFTKDMIRDGGGRDAAETIHRAIHCRRVPCDWDNSEIIRSEDSARV